MVTWSVHNCIVDCISMNYGTKTWSLYGRGSNFFHISFTNVYIVLILTLDRMVTHDLLINFQGQYMVGRWDQLSLVCLIIPLDVWPVVRRGRGGGWNKKYNYLDHARHYYEMRTTIKNIISKLDYTWNHCTHFGTKGI